MELTSDVLNQLLTYDEMTGRLYWKTRPEFFFPSKRPCNIWNTRYSGKEALITKTNGGYLSGRIFDKGYLAHRVIWCLATGAWPDEEIDHINGVASDNRLENLRPVNSSGNGKNIRKPSHNKSGHIGVYKEAYTGKWVGCAESDGRRYKKRFVTIEEAIAYREYLNEKLGFHENHGR